MLALIVVGGPTSLFSRSNAYYTRFPTVEGLVNGAKVVLGGLQVGIVEAFDFDPESGKVRVELSINRKYASWIRADTTTELRTQGVLGDKYVYMTAGAPDLA